MRRSLLTLLLFSVCATSLAEAQLLPAPNGPASPATTQVQPQPASNEPPSLAETQVVSPENVPLRKIPEGAILVKGAEPSASDSVTPLPETSSINKQNVYRNDYFGLGYHLPEEFTQPYSGPPPSDSGTYVLAQLVPSPRFHGAEKATITITAQDLFFTLLPVRSSVETIKYNSEHLPSYYKLERPPTELKLANHTFTRFDYMSPVADLHWYLLATEIRCHAVQFLLIGREPKMLEGLIGELDKLELPAEGAAPVCIANYAEGSNVISRVVPSLVDRKFNSIPVRIVIDKNGRVKHVHVISAYRDQARNITDALLQWKFKPYKQNGEAVEVETGLMFGTPRQRATSSSLSAPVGQGGSGNQ